MKCSYMGHFGQQGMKDIKVVKSGTLDEYSDDPSDSPYFDDQDNTNYKELKSSIRSDFEAYSDDPFEDFRFQYRQPGMIPVKRPLKSTLKSSDSDSGVTREYVEGDFVAPDKVVAEVKTQEVKKENSPSGRNLVLGLGAGLAALIYFNR